MCVCVCVYVWVGWHTGKGELASVLSRGLKDEGGEMGDGKKGKGKGRCHDKEVLYRVVCCCVLLWAKESRCGPFRHMGERVTSVC